MNKINVVAEEQDVLLLLIALTEGSFPTLLSPAISEPAELYAFSCLIHNEVRKRSRFSVMHEPALGGGHRVEGKDQGTMEGNGAGSSTKGLGGGYGARQGV